MHACVCRIKCFIVTAHFGETLVHLFPRNLNRVLVGVVALLLAAMASAKTVIVSDIDDTIKMSHVRNRMDSISNARRTKNRFEGMNSLYHLMLNGIEDSKIYYLTNAPGWLMKRAHTKLLANGNFPEGEVLFREKESSDEHKVKALREIIRMDQPNRMILLGDNGERDIAFYSQIREEFPEVEFFQFIRIVYSPSDYDEILNLESGQMGFVTPLEIALVLRQNAILPDAQANAFIWEIGDSILNDAFEDGDRNRPKFFPDWQNCETFEWPSIKEEASLPVVSRVYHRVTEICH